MAVHGVAHYDILEGSLKTIISNTHHLSKNNLMSSSSSQVQKIFHTEITFNDQQKNWHSIMEHLASAGSLGSAQSKNSSFHHNNATMLSPFLKLVVSSEIKFCTDILNHFCFNDDTKLPQERIKHSQQVALVRNQIHLTWVKPLNEPAEA